VDWPVPVLLSWVATEGIGIALIVAFVDGVGYRLIHARWLSVSAGAAFLAVSAVHVAMGAVQPFYWTIMLLFVDYAVLILTLRRFDLLTLMVAMVTFSFWWGNYSLYVMLQAATVQPAIAFALWGVLIVAAAAIAFKSALRATFRQMAAVVE